MEEVIILIKSHTRFSGLSYDKIKGVFDKLKELFVNGELDDEKVNDDTSSESGQIKKKKSKKKKRK